MDRPTDEQHWHYWVLLLKGKTLCMISKAFMLVAIFRNEYSNCNTELGKKNVWFVSLCSPKKVVASPTTPRFLSLTAQRNSSSSSFTSTVSFTLRRYSIFLMSQSPFHVHGLVKKIHCRTWLVSLTASPQKSLMQKSSSEKTAHRRISSMSSLETEFTCLVYMYVSTHHLGWL